VGLGRAVWLCGEVNLLLSHAMTEHPHNPLQGMTLEAILTILVIIFISVLPIAWEWFKAARAARKVAREALHTPR